MAEGGGQESFAVRLVAWPQAALRWAATGVPKPDSQLTSRDGCLNPLNLVKLAVLLVIVLIFPLFFLPLLLARLATFGRTTLQYSDALHMASGEAARRDHGALEPAADAGTVEGGLAAIARHDPGFSTHTLTTWAASAVELIGQSLTSGDATPARTIMANGLYRTHQALLELRAQAQVWCEGSWQATGATVVHAASTPLFDEVRIRLRCRGWCWEWHEPTGLTLRGCPESTSWSEDLTFGRSADATSPAAGGLPAGRCPSCGTPLDLDPDGACRYCRGVVTAGRHDWVLVAWQREPR